MEARNDPFYAGDGTLNWLGRGWNAELDVNGDRLARYLSLFTQE